MRLSFLLIGTLALFFTACEPDAVPLPVLDVPDLRTTTIAGLDSLAGAEVSVSGRVLDQPAGTRTLVLDDGTALIRVTLPETPPGLVGHRLFVRGTVSEDGGEPFLDAEEWLYDSTAVSVRSD
ncbi:MAG: hypothetical protein AAGI91_12530 [Bacteroidota bacterium]